MNAVAVPVLQPTSPRITPEEFLALPDGGRGFELVDGQLKERIVSAKSSRTGFEIGRRIGNYCESSRQAWIFMADASFRCFPDDADRFRRADIALIVMERMTPAEYESSGFIAICPDLVVEVVSPNDLYSDVTIKRNEWLAAGAKLVWIVDPNDRSVTAYQPGKRPSVYEVGDTLPGDPVLPGFSVAISDLFRLPTSA
jgi:Uma2 family endonuclease